MLKISSEGGAFAVVPLVVGLLAVFVAYGAAPGPCRNALAIFRVLVCVSCSSPYKQKPKISLYSQVAALHAMRIVELQNVPVWIMHREGILPPRLLAWRILYRKTYFLQMLV